MAYYSKAPKRRGLFGLFGDDGSEAPWSISTDESVSASSPIVAVPTVFGPSMPTAAETAQDEAATSAYYSAKADAAIAAAKAARVGVLQPVYALPAAQAQPAAQASPWSTFAATIIGAATARITTKPPTGIVKTPPVSSTTSMLLPIALIGAVALFLGPALLKKRA